MKRISLTSLTFPRFFLQVILAYALKLALFMGDPASTVLAASASADGVLLGGGKISSDGSYQFSFAASVGQTYPIGVSADMVNWTLLTNLVGTGQLVLVADLEAPKFQQRFYQIASPTFTNMVFIPPGTFTMGSPDSEEGRDSREGPQTVVTLTRGLWMGKFEVSQAEYLSVTGTNASVFTWDSRLPVDGPSWIMATNYCYLLTERERKAGRLPAWYSYRLPTEAEWEYACRAGTTGPFGIGDGKDLSSTQANFDGTFPYGDGAFGRYLHTTTLPGTYAPNAWGLYDMHGNEWEWCQDWYGPYPGGAVTDPTGPATGSERVLRGGGYTSAGEGCRSAKRDSRWDGHLDTINSFRVVLAPNP
jgi:formylglycine-generating enzyme required for sulfatase activity